LRRGAGKILYPLQESSPFLEALAICREGRVQDPDRAEGLRRSDPEAAPEEPRRQILEELEARDGRDLER
jgi:hypothetical protein